jgi:hypothetical protein
MLYSRIFYIYITTRQYFDKHREMDAYRVIGALSMVWTLTLICIFIAETPSMSEELMLLGLLTICTTIL